MKRLMAIVLAFMLVTMGITIAAATDTVTTTDMGFIPEGYAGDGYLNVGFSNGYHGFCMDEGLAGTVVGDSFTITPASQAENNNTQPTNVSNLLKAVFTEGFHTLFQKDAADNYVMTQETSQIAQRATWHFTDGYVDNWDSISPVITAAQSAVDGGLIIPDNGYTKQVDDTTEVTFDFMIMQTAKEGQQCFFAYKLTQKTIPTIPEPEDPQDPETPSDVPETPTDVPETPTDVPETPTDVPETPTDVPETPTDVPEDPDDPLMGEDGDQKYPPTQPEEEESSQPGESQPENTQPEKAPVVSENPKTGDSVALGLGVCLMAISAAALVICKKK